YCTTALFGTDGGFVFESSEARDMLVAEARALTTTLGVDHTVLRTRNVEIPNTEIDARFCTALVDLPTTSEAAWEALPSKTRNQIRRGMKEEFSIQLDAVELRPFFD